MKTTQKTVIGVTEKVSFGRRAVNVPAKVDTGADSSSIWATHIRVGRDGLLRFRLFGEGSKYYSGKAFKRANFEAVSVKSSNGKSEIRYRTPLTVTVAGRKIRAKFNLSDRSNNTYKVLIGRRAISKKFVVDVSKKRLGLPRPTKTETLNEELRKNPYEFHKKYVKI